MKLLPGALDARAVTPALYPCLLDLLSVPPTQRHLICRTGKALRTGSGVEIVALNRRICVQVEKLSNH